MSSSLGDSGELAIVNLSGLSALSCFDYLSVEKSRFESLPRLLYELSVRANQVHAKTKSVRDPIMSPYQPQPLTGYVILQVFMLSILKKTLESSLEINKCSEYDRQSDHGASLS